MLGCQCNTLHVPLAFVEPSLAKHMVLFYVIGYCAMLGYFSFTFFSLAKDVRAESAAATPSSVSQNRGRWSLVCFVFTTAGLPPFFFFGCKIGLISLLVSNGSWVVLGFSGALVLVSWAVYFGTAIQLMNAHTPATTKPLRRSIILPCAAAILLTLLVSCVAGFVVFEDGYLWLCAFLR